MNWYQKIGKAIFKKGLDDDDETDGVTVGGLDILKRFIAPELTTSGMMHQYRKSLYVFACISKIAQKVASTEFKMMRILNSRGEMKEVATHPALDLIYKPNPFQTKTEFLERTIIHLKTTGEAYWLKIRNKSGRVMELWNLRPDLMTTVVDSTKFIKEYRLTTSGGNIEIYAPTDIVAFKYPDPLSQYLGLSPMFPAQHRIMSEEYMARYQRDFFLNNARPDAVIKNTKNNLNKDQREDLRDDWDKKYKGVGKNSKVAILQGGLEYQQISISQREMDYIESMKANRDDILVAFQVPKVILSIVEDVNRANAETGMYIFLSETIEPEIKRLTEKLNEEMIYQDFGNEFMLQHVSQVPANRELELKENSEGIQFNYKLINEVRKREGDPPLRGGWSFYMPLTSIAVGGLNGQDQGKASVTEYRKLLEAHNKAMELAQKNDTENQKIIQEAAKPKAYDFKGRYWLKFQMEVKENITALFKKAKPAKKKKDGEKTPKAMLAGEARKNYHQLINKQIDAKTAGLKAATNDFMRAQGERVAAALQEKFKSVKKTFKKISKKDLKVTEIFDKEKENSLTVDFIIPYITEYLTQAGLDALNMIAPQEDFNTTQQIKKRIQKRAEDFADSVSGTTLDKLKTTLADGIADGDGIRDLSNRVEEVYKEFPAWRSELIARTEATNANNEGILEGFKQSEVTTGKEWINAGDDRVREEHQDGIGVGGEIVELSANFSNGLPFPQEPNCRCVLGPAFLE